MSRDNTRHLRFVEIILVDSVVACFLSPDELMNLKLKTFQGSSRLLIKLIAKVQTIIQNADTSVQRSMALLLQALKAGRFVVCMQKKALKLPA